MSDLKNKCIGFDFGGDCFHAVIREKGRIVRAVTEQMPEGLLGEGRILSYDAMSDYLKEARRRFSLYVRDAAFVLPDSQCYCRRTRMPLMNEEQLRFNLPYEFRDYIAGAKEDYFYDYALVETVPGAEDGKGELDLMAAAVNKLAIHDLREMFHRAGFQLKTAVPEEMAYINLVRRAQDLSHVHCILDIGHTGVRLYIFEGDRFESVRALDFGCASVISSVADHFGVDIHVARNYLTENYEGAAELPVCKEIYGDIGVELVKAVNYYRFNNRDEELAHIHCCGGGTRNRVLMDALREALPMPVTDMSEFLSDADDKTTDLAAAAAGTALQ